MKPDNPFLNWLTRDVYGGYWVPVGQLGGWIGAAALPLLVRAESRDAVLSSTDWPMQLDSATPEVWESFSNDEVERGSELHPFKQTEHALFRAFVALFDPFGRPSWLEPIQSFVLYCGSWPKHDPDGNIIWFEEGDDGQPEEIARWTVDRFQDRTTLGTLVVRRDRLLGFLSAFEFDLAIYFTETVDADALDEGWEDSGVEETRAWRCWATDTELGRHRVVASIRAVKLIERPPYDEGNQPWHREEQAGLQYPVDMDPTSGKPVFLTYPPGEFLTPVFFGESVLDKYYADPQLYVVEENVVRGGRQWLLPFARTGRGTVQVWLGDISELPTSVQSHWQPYAAIDEGGVPEWRIRTDLLAQFVDIPSEGPISRLKEAISKANDAAEARFGQTLYAAIDETHAESIRVLRIPPNNSMTAFLEQVRPLALLLIDHLNPELLDSAGVSRSGQGSLNRLAQLVSATSGKSEEESRELIGGLFAVQAIRSNVSAHRTGREADSTLQRAGISKLDLPAGFASLVSRAAESLENLRQVFEANE